ncbi:uncharacterized protein F54F2.9 isoform X2 [Anopheles cruzii]|uniref:uncharacterized protein F54F2.9 isoform X2 n=1 Tax=Anopheles cruzii TaxID=68878 RepID=UPI0022EC7B63|nr:uncharacterized protein F54F2.9 isoform X2 [Anopheles cruzii]
MATDQRQILLLMVICFTASVANGWSADDMEIFDLVEEVNENFYQLMNINQTASLAEIKRAFRTLSIVLHPDKSDADDANIKFRNLVSVYEILKDPAKREKYDRVLNDGLPNWKSALYYYRHVRKMGIAESATILFVVITVMQYLVAWAAYIEKKYTAEQIVGNKLKKFNKKNQTNIQLEELINEIPIPSIKNTLPFQLPLSLWRLVTGLPHAIDLYVQRKKAINEIHERELKEAKEQQEFERKRAEEKANRMLRKRNKKISVPEKTDEELAAYSQRVLQAGDEPHATERLPVPPPSGGLWTDDDLTELVRLVKKYPGGTSNRWEQIADLMQRSVDDVTYMAAKLKECGYRLSHQLPETNASDVARVKTKTRDRGVTAVASESCATWTQQQQQALEAAIQKHPKSTTTDRWQKIANSVPGKTKEDCIARYKYLVDLVKTQKKETEDGSELPASTVGAEEVPPAPIEGTEQEPEPHADDNTQSEEAKPPAQKGGKSKKKPSRKEKRQPGGNINEVDEVDWRPERDYTRIPSDDSDQWLGRHDENGVLIPEPVQPVKRKRKRKKLDLSRLRNRCYSDSE